MVVLSSAAVRVALLYLLIALPWVWGSDLVLHAFAPSAEVAAWFGAAKGTGFVLVTTLVLYVGVRGWTDSVTRSRRAAEASEARLASFVATMDDVVFITDTEQRFVEVLGPATTTTSRAQFLGKRASDIFGDEAGATFQEIGQRALAGEIVEIDWSVDESPPMFPVASRVTSMHVTVAPIRAADGTVTGLVGVGRNTSPIRAAEAGRARAERRIESLRDSDPLTGLANRTLMERRLAEAMADAADQQELVALNLLNLDEFRDVNDSLGYEVGDDLLRAVAARIELHQRPGETLARLAGDDFVLIQRGLTSVDQAIERAAALIHAFDEPYAVIGYELREMASVGVALFPEHAQRPLDLLRAADAAMHTAKADPVHRWVAYEPTMASAATDRLQMANELRAAVEHDEIEVAYQPIVRAGDGRVIAFEALARWTSVTRGPVPPAEFIPVAERVGLIDDLGQSVRLKAYSWLAQAHALGFTDLQIEVNVSPQHFLRGNVDRLVEEAAMVNLDPRYIVLEITESALVDIRGQALSLLNELTRHGFSLAVDDFGTGYSSLAYLAQLPVTVVKVAQEFTQDAPLGAEVSVNHVVVETAIQLSQRLGYQTIAEGVEDASVVAYLERVGIDAHQGYFFARPATGDIALDYLRRTGTPGRPPEP